MSRMTIALSVALLAAQAGAASNPIQTWNRTLLSSIAAENVSPPAASRMMAMVHAAQADAVANVTGAFRAYGPQVSSASGTSAQAAAASAARDVMVSLFPSRQSIFDAQLAAEIGSMPVAGRAEGVALGRACAVALVSMRAGDGSATANFTYNGGTAIGQWRPTPPANQSAALPGWRYVTPWAMNDRGQFRAAPPPAVDSAEYTAAYNEVRELGAVNSATRTQHQTDTAFLWRAGPNTVTPPGMWMNIADQIATTRGMSLEDTARLFGTMSIAVADAAISAWETKNTYDYWRPVTGIRLGETDGNGDTAGDASWTPLFATPNHQSYTSGHSTFSSAAAAVLSAFLGTDSVTFTATGDGVTRTYTSIEAAMLDAGMSRIYGGIHWQFDNQAGLLAGTQVGQWAFANVFQVPAPGVGVLVVGGIAAAARRRRG